MIHQILHWLAVHTGTIDEAGPYYGFFSGFGSDIGEVAIIGGLISIYRRHTCSVHKCWRIGRHRVPGTSHTCCRRHAPGGSPTHQDILDAHHAWRHRQHGEPAAKD